jgi:uncharacterized membrane protein YhaH (DUF805 family)
MGALQYFFGFNGRINRAKIWLFLLIVIGLEIVTFAIAIFGFDWTEWLKSVKAQAEATPGQIDWCTLVWPKIAGAKASIALVAIIAIIAAYFWAVLAVYAKRLHDRAKSAWWLLGYVALPAVLQGYAYSTATGHMNAASMTLPGKVAYGIAVLIGLWVFIELYCFKGTKGANRFGDDPLGPVYCTPDKPAKGCIPKP